MCLGAKSQWTAHVPHPPTGGPSLGSLLKTLFPFAKILFIVKVVRIVRAAKSDNSTAPQVEHHSVN
jgi:hypothetical protein